MSSDRRIFIDPMLQKLSDYYFPGRVIPRLDVKTEKKIGYSKVISFDVPSKFTWSQFTITVIACDEFGMPLKGAKPSVHCKNPFIK